MHSICLGCQNEGQPTVTAGPPNRVKILPQHLLDLIHASPLLLGIAPKLRLPFPTAGMNRDPACPSRRYIGFRFAMTVVEALRIVPFDNATP